MISARAISVPGEINTFPQGEHVTVPASILSQLLKEYNNLKAKVVNQDLEIANLKAKIAILESTLADHDQRITILEENHDKDMERLFLNIAQDRQRLTALEQPTPGAKTLTRVQELKKILQRCRGGAQTFQQTQRDLRVSPSQFTRLCSFLDKRVFETFRRPGGKHGEKVVKLRAVFT